jgi:flagellin-specific chaperone FliS
LAEQELQESLSILQDLNSLYEIGKTLFQIAWLYQVRGDQAQMQMRLGQAQSIFEGLGARLDLIRAQKLAQA